MRGTVVWFVCFYIFEFSFVKPICYKIERTNVIKKVKNNIKNVVIVIGWFKSNGVVEFNGSIVKLPMPFFIKSNKNYFIFL